MRNVPRGCVSSFADIRDSLADRAFKFLSGLDLGPYYVTFLHNVLYSYLLFRFVWASIIHDGEILKVMNFLFSNKHSNFFILHFATL